MREISGAPRKDSSSAPVNLREHPAGATAQWQHSGHPEILQVYLRDSIYAAAVEEIMAATYGQPRSCPDSPS